MGHYLKMLKQRNTRIRNFNLAQIIWILKKFWRLRILLSFGTSYDIKFQPEVGLELNNSENWNVNNWITGNQDDGFEYDGCSAFQKILDGKGFKH